MSLRNLYSGYNGYNEVYSFLPVNGNIDRFSGDVFEFLTVSVPGHMSIRLSNVCVI